MKNIQRIISIWLVICMLVSMLPMHVFANGEVLDRESAETTASSCGENMTWTLVDGVLTISGTGAMDNYNTTEPAPWDAYRSSIASVIIEEDITSIGNYAFSGCSFITSVTIPKGIVSIGEYAFSSCYRLTDVIIPSGITNIGESAFTSCYGIVELLLPDSIVELGVAAFYDCSNLESITLPDGITSIAHHTFFNCNSLSSVVFLTM